MESRQIGLVCYQVLHWFSIITLLFSFFLPLHQFLKAGKFHELSSNPANCQLEGEIRDEGVKRTKYYIYGGVETRIRHMNKDKSDIALFFSFSAG